MSATFDDAYDRTATRSTKWDAYETYLKVPSGPDVLPMWVADMDFPAPDFLTDAVRDLADKGDFGYFAHVDTMCDAIVWWMQTRHNWTVDPAHITPVLSLGNAIAMAIQTWSNPGDAVAIMTPVYHEFASKIARNGRTVTELPLLTDGPRFEMDLAAWETRLTGKERILLLCSPHNPGGRVWSASELDGVAAFCARHDILLVSDEVHHDIVLPGETFTPTAHVLAGHNVRFVAMTSASKTFSIAGSRLGTVIIADQALRNAFRHTVHCSDIAPNLLGTVLTRAAYSPQGAAWVDDMNAYIAGNVAAFKAAIDTIPGAKMSDLEGTYLAWVDFSGTGLNDADLWARVTGEAKIVPSPGLPFGTGGSQGLRFNLGTQRANVLEAGERLKRAFSDLQ
ncbi:PatB family C-S lyase [Celeribacter arenosi]|uniref:Aminotransferase n=1 Tax=Celeribacter arenosi TaxID=792649 RepID=A0ABP7JZI7_9RHOB